MSRALPTHDPNGCPLSAAALAELAALPEEVRHHPVMVAIANAPVEPFTEEEREALAECDPNGPWIPGEEVTRTIEERRRAEEDSAAE